MNRSRADEIYQKSFSNNPDKDGIQKMNDFMTQMFQEALTELPVTVRLGYLCNTINQRILETGSCSLDFKKINELLSKRIGEYDYNMLDKVTCIEDIFRLRSNCAAAQCDIGDWQKHKCKQCGEEFYLGIEEVNFFMGMGLNIPKRCHECREKAKNKADANNKASSKNMGKVNIQRQKHTVTNEGGKSAMQLAMEKAGLL